MTVTVGGVPLEEPLPDCRALVHAHPHFQESANRLASQPPKVIGPVGLLYVHQREMAVTVSHDKNVNILGSDDATTCIILILRHTTSGAVGLAHCDGVGTDEGLLTLITRIQELALGYPEGRLQLQLVGGYSDPNNYTDELFYNILHAFHKQPVEIELTLMCTGDMNTTVRNGIHWPIIYGAGVNVKTGELFPATFPEKGPELSLRTARHLALSQPSMLDVYDCGLGLLRIGPFSYQPLRGVDLWLEQPDDIILQHLSTSPQVEPPHFKEMHYMKYIVYLGLLYLIPSKLFSLEHHVQHEFQITSLPPWLQISHRAQSPDRPLKPKSLKNLINSS